MIQPIDHPLLTLVGILVGFRFFKPVPGMEIVSFGERRQALRFGQRKINLQQAGSEFEPRAQHPTPGSANLRLISDTPLTTVQAHIEEQEVAIIEGPVRRTGAGGPMIPLHFHDPDQNLIEVAEQLDLN